MDVYEATRIVLSRIEKVDPENASRIMGLLLIQDHGDKEMIRLAFGPESLLHSVILNSRNDLGLSSSSSPSTPLSASPFFSRLLVPPPDDLLAPNCFNINSSPLPFYNHDDLQLSFLNEDGHRRSCSVSDADDPSSGFGWKPCLYYARGFCKNGGSCRFLHGGDAASPHHQRLAAAFPYSPKSIALLLQQQNDSQIRRNELMVSPASRQIYLTFPADSSFREDDVSNYFSIYGPVQDVRIPYQHKRMFGFVTFVYPETVKLILAKGNPHFVCDARVLVKPYKEKPKLTIAPENNNNCRKQQMERGGDFSPSALDSFDLSSPGGGVFYNSSQEMMWTRKMEEQALEVQSRRLMNLQLLDVKKHHHHHQRALSTGSPIPSPTLFSPRSLVLPTALDQQMGMSNGGLRVSTGKESPPVTNSNAQESLEHNLPDSPFASPTKASSDSNYFTIFSNGNATGEPERDATNSNSSPTLLPPPSLDMASFQSFNCQPSRFSSGHGAIGMFAGTGGSTFPVGI